MDKSFKCNNIKYLQISTPKFMLKSLDIDNKYKERLMSRKKSSKSKTSRLSVTSTKKIRKIKGFSFALIAVPLLLVIGLGSFFVLGQINDKAYAASNVTPKGCANDSYYSNQSVTAFVQAYQQGHQAKITAYLVCGKLPIWTDTFIEFDLAATNKTVKDTQYTYLDGQPRGKASHYNCTLKVVNSSTADLTCGKDSFNLYL
jgi:hypothetical protein